MVSATVPSNPVSLQKPYQSIRSTVTGRYCGGNHAPSLAANAAKLRAVMRFFGLTPAEVARAVGVSRCYISRVMSETDCFTGTAAFYRRAEATLGLAIQNRTTQVFAVEPVATNAILR
jgi:hypothetical protein